MFEWTLATTGDQVEREREDVPENRFSCQGHSRPAEGKEKQDS
jgi:hypothetical protein